MLAKTHPCATPRSVEPARRRTAACASGSSAGLGRRTLLVAAPILLSVAPALADELSTFYGAANPPATYGGVGGTTPDKARYSFSVPSGWTEDAVSKTEKGASGVDTRFVGTGRSKKSRVYVVTLRSEGSREGEGRFVMKDAESGLKAVTGGDFALQDILAGGALKTAPAPGGGFRYELSGPTCLLAQLETASDGRLFAIFVVAPAADFEANKSMYEEVVSSFKTYSAA